ncbi:MAG: anthranilate phosphoribosyltransferase [Candidatus Nanoarchaeia archaeon]
MASQEIKETLYRLSLGLDIPPSILKPAFLSLFTEEYKGRDAQLGALLVGLMSKKPTIDEVCCIIDAALTVDGFQGIKKQEIDLPPEEFLISSIGSGKKGLKTFNISTTSLLVASSLGTYTYKPVSHSTSSLTGSADFLIEIGANLDIETSKMIDIVKKTRFGAFSIENLIPQFDRIYGKKFYAPHILSFGLPALVTPIKTDNILYGLAHPNIDLSVKILQKYGFSNALIISSSEDQIHYVDEALPFGKTNIIGIKKGHIGPKICLELGTELNLHTYTSNDIAEGKTIQENISYGINVLSGKGSPAHEDIVCLNAGNILYLANKAENYAEGYHLAKQAIKTGKPLEKLIEFVEETGGTLDKINQYLKK